MHTSKIGDLPLFATVGALAAVWLIAVVGLSLTIKREYLHTFLSLQTGYAATQSIFLDSQGNDAKRISIFYKNERHWQAIRDRMRQWVLSAYAAWQALMPAFFTADLQARIPDDFMPAQAVQDLNAQSRAGRRPTLQNMGLVRRASHASPSGVASELNSDARRPSQLPSSPSVTTNSASVLPASNPTDPTASAAIIMPHASTVQPPVVQHAASTTLHSSLTTGPMHASERRAHVMRPLPQRARCRVGPHARRTCRIGLTQLSCTCFDGHCAHGPVVCEARTQPPSRLV